jgi:malate dehydrogenase (oxaloacetate-decarboxylating)
MKRFRRSSAQDVAEDESPVIGADAGPEPETSSPEGTAGAHTRRQATEEPGTGRPAAVDGTATGGEGGGEGEGGETLGLEPPAEPALASALGEPRAEAGSAEAAGAEAGSAEAAGGEAAGAEAAGGAPPDGGEAITVATAAAELAVEAAEAVEAETKLGAEAAELGATDLLAPEGQPTVAAAAIGAMPVPRKTKWIAADGAYETTLRGREIVTDPLLFRGVAFTEQERVQLGLVGVLPPRVLTIEEQIERAMEQYRQQPSDLAKNIYLSLLEDRNEVLFYRLLSDNLPEMLPIVYTPTVASAIEHFSHEYRKPRGVFISVDRPDEIEASLVATGLGPDDVDLIVTTDGEAILGIGDWGVGGIKISLGKLTVYTAAGGVDPGRAIAVVLDVGTNRQSLLEDPLYLGNRHPRVDQPTYDAFVDSFVEIASRLFPNALLHWEDLAARNARRILDRWRENACTFNDDMQGTGAVVLAAVMSGLRRSKGRLADQRVVIFGAGTAGMGIAEQLRDAMVADGLDNAEAMKRFWCVDRNGLLVEALEPVMAEIQRRWARPDSEVEGWERDDDGRITLTEVIRHVEATILIGTSGQHGAFTEDTIRAMALTCQNPIILPMSNPTDLVEAEPWDIMQWTGGRALVATGSAFDPVTYAWSTHYIAQANNALVFPGLGLGAALVGAIAITDGMLFAAAQAISGQVDLSIDGALLPEIDTLRATSLAVAAAVGQAAIDEGVARWALPDPLYEGIDAAMWKPEYRPIRAV